MKMGPVIAALQFRAMLPEDAPALALQPSQHFELGLEHRQFTLEEGADLVSGGLAWTAHRGERIVAIAGFRELFHAGSGHAVAWAALAGGLGADHVAITRFARRQVAAASWSRFARIEAIVDAGQDRALKWAKLVGLEPVHVLRAYGPEGRDHILLEKIG